MNATRKRWNLLVSLVFVLAGSWGTALGVVAEPGDDVLKTILDDWQKRQQRTRTLQCSVAGTGLIPKRRYNTDPEYPPERKGTLFPPEDYTFEKTSTWYLDFVKNLVHKEETTYDLYCPPWLLTTAVDGYIYDGKTAQFYEPKEGNTHAGVKRSSRQPDLYFRAPKEGDLFFEGWFDYPLFFATGNIHVNDVKLEPRRLRIPLNRKIFYVHGRGKKNGRDCVVLRSYPKQNRGVYFDELWVDVEQESAIVHWTRNNRWEFWLQTTSNGSNIPTAGFRRDGRPHITISSKVIKPWSCPTAFV